MSKTVVQIVGTLVEELTPLSSEDRQRVLQAALALLGETQGVSSHNFSAQKVTPEALGGDVELPPRARNWLRQNHVTSEQIENVFHKGESGLELIASEMPGKTNREKVRNAYVLIGLARFLETGEGKFDDKPARALCERYGFFDGTNHTKYMKDGNEFTGSKDKGWTLTAPGLKRGAALITEIANTL